MKKVFTGILNKPMPPFKLGLLLNDEQIKEAISERINLEDNKLKLLAKHFEVEENDYRGLCITLAKECGVPGFQPSAAGRKKKWSPFVLSILYVEMKRQLQSLGGNKATEAAKVLAKQKHWLDFLESISESVGIYPNPAEAIRKAYYRSNKEKFSELTWKGYCYHEETNTVHDWDSLVIDILKKPF